MNPLTIFVLYVGAIALLSESGKKDSPQKEKTKTKRELETEQQQAQQRREAYEAEVRRQKERYNVAQERAEKAGCVACPNCLVAVPRGELCSSCGWCRECSSPAYHDSRCQQCYDNENSD